MVPGHEPGAAVPDGVSFLVGDGQAPDRRGVGGGGAGQVPGQPRVDRASPWILPAGPPAPAKSPAGRSGAAAPRTPKAALPPPAGSWARPDPPGPGAPTGRSPDRLPGRRCHSRRRYRRYRRYRRSGRWCPWCRCCPWYRQRARGGVVAQGAGAGVVAQGAGAEFCVEQQVQVGAGAQLIHAAAQPGFLQLPRPPGDPLIRGEHLGGGSSRPASAAFPESSIHRCTRASFSASSRRFRAFCGATSITARAIAERSPPGSAAPPGLAPCPPRPGPPPGPASRWPTR